MLPIRDENPTELTPYVTVLIIVANFAVWVLLQGAGVDPHQLEASVAALGTHPCELTRMCQARGLGWSELLTSMFTHGGWGHILGNMWFLWVFGNNIEDSMGHVRFLVFYLLCGIAAGLAHIAAGPASAVPAVGASGAISGVMGAYIVLYPNARVRTWIPPIFFFNIRAFFFLLYWFVVQVFMASSTLGTEESGSGGVAVWAHVGGFVAGVVLIKLFENRTLVAARKRGIVLPQQVVARDEWRL